MQVNMEDNTKVNSSERALSVSFLEYACYREIRSIADYAKDEIVGKWYTEDDYREFKENCKTTAKMMMKGTVLQENEAEFCYRGLESRTKEGYKTRRRYKEAVRFAVSDEHQVQDDKGYVDENAIAEVSMQASLASRKAARQIGLDDQLRSREMNKLVGYRNNTREAQHLLNSTGSPTIHCNKGGIHGKRSLRAMGLAF
jgi:hypothetical protein